MNLKIHRGTQEIGGSCIEVWSNNTRIVLDFGMPLVEAMSQGCVPIAGNHSSIPEVVGDAGILVEEVSDPDLITHSMEMLLTDETFRIDRVEAGIKRSRDFCWEKSARQTLSLYEQTIQPPRKDNILKAF